MKKTFTIENTTYTVLPCTAIAGCDLESGDRQNALYVVSHMNGEKFESVVFGWEMPETMDDYMAMCEDSGAWESDYEVAETVKVID